MKPYVEYNPAKHGGCRISRYPGNCKWCGLHYSSGSQVNWNPRVKGTCCHAGCYGEYGSPVVVDTPTPVDNPTPTPTFVPNPNAPKVEPIAERVTEDPIGSVIMRYLEGRLKGLVTEEQVSSILDKILDGRTLKTVTTITIERETEYGIETANLGVQHKMFQDLLDILQAGLHPWIAGPAGSGKTTAVQNVAKALGYGFYMTGAIDNEYKLTGFTTATGEVVSTEFRRAVEYAIAHPESGAIFLWDEVDRSMHSALLAFNAVLSNGLINFPDKQLQKPNNLYFAACANTWGLPSGEYVGAMKQDAAFVDRFCPLEWDYDEDLERAMVSNDAWVTRVQQIRARARAKGIKVLITPRASISGAKLLARGVLQSKVESRLLRKTMSEADWNSVKGVN